MEVQQQTEKYLTCLLLDLNYIKGKKFSKISQLADEKSFIIITLPRNRPLQAVGILQVLLKECFLSQQHKILKNVEGKVKMSLCITMYHATKTYPVLN
jgi:hypothetical protein